jgi:putative transposon-encoded protein
MDMDIDKQDKREMSAEFESTLVKWGNSAGIALPKPIVWKAITDPKEIFGWMSDYKGVIDGYNSDGIDVVNTVTGSHVTGDILVGDVHHVFEY